MDREDAAWLSVPSKEGCQQRCWSALLSVFRRFDPKFWLMDSRLATGEPNFLPSWLLVDNLLLFSFESVVELLEGSGLHSASVLPLAVAELTDVGAGTLAGAASRGKCSDTSGSRTLPKRPPKRSTLKVLCWTDGIHCPETSPSRKFRVKDGWAPEGGVQTSDGDFVVAL